MKIYDIAVVGAGVAGVMVAWWAKRFGKSVLVIDRANSPATGGSSAAGAFISPKLGKANALTNLTNDAFKFSSKFYSKFFSKYFEQSGMVRFAKDESDLANLEYYKEVIGCGEILDEKSLRELGVVKETKALYFRDGGVCDAQNLCKKAIEDIEYLQFEVKDVKEADDCLIIEDRVKAKNVVFATGYEGFNGFEYMSISGLWGSRGDYYSNDEIKVCMHKSVSVSSNIEGIIKLGATTTRAKNPCMVCDGEPLKALEEKAVKIANLKDFKIKEIFCGYRANSKDYFPIVGKVIDAKYMLKNYPQIKKGYKKAPLKYKDRWYVLNGLGARGFVFAPLMAKHLINLIVENRNIEDIINSDRLFLKWARKLDK